MSERLILRRAVPGTARPGFDGVLVPWMEPADVTDPDGSSYREAWAPGSITVDGPVPVFDGHDPVTLERGALIGVVDAVHDDGDALRGAVSLARAGRAAEVRDLADLIRPTLSMEVVADQTAATVVDGLTVRSRGQLVGLAVCFPPTVGAYPGAVVTALRSSSTPTEEPAMPTTMTDTPPADPDVPDPDAPADPPDEDTGAMLEAMAPAMRAAVAAEVARLRLATPTPGSPASPLARFRTFGDYAHAALRDPVLLRALADQVTTDNPGVMPPGWVSEVFGIVDQASPLLAALRRPAPPNGLDVNWPYFEGDLYALVGAQAAEKTAITSVKVSLKRGTQALETYAGGSDISYQLLTRSDPSYLDAYMRIMAAAYAAVCGKAFTTALAASTATVTLDPATADAGDAAAAIFEASMKVAQATGSPASIIGAGSAMFLALAKAALQPSLSTPGDASASTLAVSYAGLAIAFDPTLAADVAVATNRQAAAWYSDGPFVVNAEDVEKLGRDTAVWGLGTPGLMTPAGVVVISDGIPLAQRRGRSSS